MTPRTGEALVELRGLVAGYAGVAVVRDLSLRVDAGEVVALLGPNGAGKTTTLLTVSALLPPIAGEVVVLGEPVGARTRPHRLARRGVAHVPEDRALFSQLSVRENLVIGRARRQPVPLDQVLDYFPALEGLLDRQAGLLSGGEQQMLALARALVRRPRLLLVDEMSLGLAPVIVERLVPGGGPIAHRPRPRASPVEPPPPQQRSRSHSPRSRRPSPRATSRRSRPSRRSA